MKAGRRRGDSETAITLVYITRATFELIISNPVDIRTLRHRKIKIKKWILAGAIRHLHPDVRQISQRFPIGTVTIADQGQFGVTGHEIDVPLRRAVLGYAIDVPGMKFTLGRKWGADE